MPEHPKKGDKLYTAFNGKLEVVTFIGLTPNGRAYEMENPVTAEKPFQFFAERRFQCAPEMYCRTELEAWQRCYKECTDAIEPAKKAVEDAEDYLENVDEEANKAAMNIMRLTPLAPAPDRFLVIVGDDYGRDYYGPFDALNSVEAWIKGNLRGATANLAMKGEQVEIAWIGAVPRESVEVCKVGFKFKPTIVRDGH
jgi:hypothetical protein